MALNSRFFRIPSSSVDGYSAGIAPNNDVLNLDVFDDSITLYDFGDGTVLIHAIIKDHTIQAMADMAEIEDPLSMAGALALGLAGIYVGMDYSETPYTGLFWFLPELKGTRMEIDSEGNISYVDIIPRHQWGAV
jgi:hypothetical protein